MHDVSGTPLPRLIVCVCNGENVASHAQSTREFIGKEIEEYGKEI